LNTGWSLTFSWVIAKSKLVAAGLPPTAAEPALAAWPLAPAAVAPAALLEPPIPALAPDPAALAPAFAALVPAVAAALAPAVALVPAVPPLGFPAPTVAVDPAVGLLTGALPAAPVLLSTLGDEELGGCIDAGPFSLEVVGESPPPQAARLSAVLSSSVADIGKRRNVHMTRYAPEPGPL
jgi:hypothetical protein